MSFHTPTKTSANNGGPTAIRRSTVCALLVLSIASLSATRRAGFDPNPVFTLTTYAAGASAAHALSFQVNAGELELYRAIISYGESFRVRGFQTQGAMGSPVGSYELDVDADGAPERVMPLRSVAADTAYVDIIADNVFSPDLEPVVTVAGDALQLRLPFGGDANDQTRVAPFGARVTLVLFPQLIVNPLLGGDYPILALFTSVDPDTDGPDDGVGTPPDTSHVSVTVHINGPVLAPFARLKIEDFDLHDHESSRERDRWDHEWDHEWDRDSDHDSDRGSNRGSGDGSDRDRGPDHDGFVADGRYLLGRASDGIKWRTDAVTVSFASFRQTIPANAFIGNAHIREYRGVGPGVRRMKLWGDGRFEIDVRRLHLIIPERRQAFSLRIGNDLGETIITLPLKHGRNHR